MHQFYHLKALFIIQNYLELFSFQYNLKHFQLQSLKGALLSKVVS